MKDGYPVTKDMKLCPKRIRAAAAYGSKFGVMDRLKKGGLCTVARKKKIKVKSCT